MTQPAKKGGRGALALLAVGLVMMLTGLIAAAAIQTASGVSVTAVRFQGKTGAHMRALLFRPAGATAASPAPAILAAHGYLNSAEIQANFAIELARRGYVVLAPDQRGHGGSDPAVFQDGFGGPDALAYLRSLPFVDRDNIGLEGHSMGGWTVMAAAKALPQGYRAMVLEGSSVGAPFAPEGNPGFPRNLMVVYGTRDEFGGFMWGPQAPLHTGATPKAMALFGADQPIAPGKIYGDIGKGQARRLETPALTHAWLHESPVGIGLALDWFGRTLEGGKPLAVTDQIWPWKEAAGALALAGVAPLLFGLFGLLLRSSKFRLLAGPPAPRSGPTRGAFAGLIAMAIVPVLSYLPLMQLAERWLGQNGLLRQTYTNQILVWAVVNAGLALLMQGLTRSAPRPAFNAPLRALGLAGAVAAGLYGVIAAADLLGHVNPQLWILIWRPLTWSRLRDFLVYLPFLTFYAIVTIRTLDTLRPLDQGRAGSTFAVAAGVLAGPFALFLVVQYGALVATGALFSPTEGLRVIGSILFVPLMLLVAGLAVGTARMTRDVLPGALLCGLLITWFLTATQPIGVG